MERAQQDDTDPIFAHIRRHFTEIYGHGQMHDDGFLCMSFYKPCLLVDNVMKCVSMIC